MQQLSPQLTRIQSNLNELEATRLSPTTKLRGQLDLSALRPNVDPEEPFLDWFTRKGAPAGCNDQPGAGGGLWWQSRHGFSISANYLAGNGAKGHTGEGASAAQLQPAPPAGRWATEQRSGGQPLQSGWLPSISAGWGGNGTNYDSVVNTQGLVTDSQSWSIGLQWSDVLSIGNTLGMAVGQPIFATGLYGGSQTRDGNTVWEWWYEIQLSDNLAIRRATFLLNRRLGDDTPASETFRQIGPLLKTTLHFTSPHPSHHRKNGYR